MQCPTDGAVLVMSERSGIEIDYCPTCRGVWLDRGELDKIIERSEQAPTQAAPPLPSPGSYEQQRDERRQDSDQRYQQPHRQKRKESWLSEILG